MTRDQFVSLPLRIALGIIYDIARTQRLVDMPMPDVPKPPLFDGRISKNGGFMWMSEMILGDLEWWERAKQKTASEGGQYAQQAAKAATTLQKWIAWRLVFPSEVWSGKRGDERVSGAPPSRNPRINEWGPRSDSKKPSGGKAPAGTEQPRPEDEGEDYGF